MNVSRLVATSLVTVLLLGCKSVGPNPKRVSREQAIAIVESVLELNGFSTVIGDKVWGLLGKEGLRSCIIGVPVTYPPEELEGAMVTGILTPREREVLGHLADGHTTREIATLLSITVPTVRNHIDHILHKLHAHSRLEAVAVSRRLGLH